MQGREIFAWDDTIYNPGGFDIPAWLVAHEKVHQGQQDGDPQAWWEKYLVDEQFRFDMELAAHQQEYRTYCQCVKDRNAQIRYLTIVARKLAAPLYGSLISISAAKRRLG